MASSPVSPVLAFFVQLEDLLIDGLVHVTALKRDYYQFDPVRHQLVGEMTNRRYQLGDRLKVEVVRVDMEDRKIDFDLVASLSEREDKQSKSAKGKKRKPSKVSKSRSGSKKDKKKSKK